MRTDSEILRTTKVTLMLADHAQVADGKLWISGGGWSVTGPNIAPFAIVALIEMPWEAAGATHEVRFDLLDDQGKPVMVETPEGDQPLFFSGQIPLTPAPGTKRGTPLTMPIAVNFAPAPPIPMGGRFEWRVEVNGETHEDWRIGFNTRPEAQSFVA